MLVFVVVPLALAYGGGSVHIPHNDDWAFARITNTLADTGTLQLVGWNEMMLVTHAAWGWLFVEVLGPGSDSLALSGAVAAALALVGSYVVARHFLTPGRAALACFTVAAFPGFSVLATTFMTDVTGFAFQVWSIAAGLRALSGGERVRWRWVVVSLVLALAAFGAREFGILAGIAVLCGAWLVDRRGGAPRWRAPVASVALLGCAAILYRWRHTYPGNTPQFGGLDLPRLALAGATSFFTIAFGLLVPLTLTTTRRTAATRPRIGLGVAAATGAFGIVVIAAHAALGRPLSVFVGNLFTRFGPAGNALAGDRAALFPASLWGLLLLLAVVAGGVVAGRGAAALQAAYRRRSETLGRMAPKELVVGAWAVLTAAGLLFRSAFGGLLYDRYLWALVLPAAILLLRAAPARQEPATRRAVAIAVALTSAVSLANVVGGQQYDVARWEAGERALARGAAPEEVDAGFEWVGFHYAGVAGGDAPALSSPPRTWYLTRLFPHARNCYVVAESELPDAHLEVVDEIRYRQWLVAGEKTLILYRNPPACAGPSSG